jgi:hypothetical protein
LFVLGKPFQPSPLFVDKARSIPETEAFERFNKVGSCFTNIRLHWKNLPGTNTSLLQKFLY